jgi:hypothetical protein
VGRVDARHVDTARLSPDAARSEGLSAAQYQAQNACKGGRSRPKPHPHTRERWQAPAHWPICKHHTFPRHLEGDTSPASSSSSSSSSLLTLQLLLVPRLVVVVLVVLVVVVALLLLRTTTTCPGQPLTNITNIHFSHRSIPTQLR